MTIKHLSDYRILAAHADRCRRELSILVRCTGVDAELGMIRDELTNLLSGLETTHQQLIEELRRDVLCQ